MYVSKIIKKTPIEIKGVYTFLRSYIIVKNTEYLAAYFVGYVDVDMKDGDKLFFAHFFVPPPLPAMSLYRKSDIFCCVFFRVSKYWEQT